MGSHDYYMNRGGMREGWKRETCKRSLILEPVPNARNRFRGPVRGELGGVASVHETKLTPLSLYDICKFSPIPTNHGCISTKATALLVCLVRSGRTVLGGLMARALVRSSSPIATSPSQMLHYCHHRCCISAETTAPEHVTEAAVSQKCNICGKYADLSTPPSS